MFYVYLIQSEKDKSFYIGQTQDIITRLERHNNGFVMATRHKLPWKLIRYENYLTREKARWREYILKNSFLEKKKFINKFLSL